MNKLYALVLLMGFSVAGQAQNLVAHYNFDSCSVSDISSNALHLTAGGSSPSPVCTTGAAGLPNTARYFSGSNWYETARSTKLALNKWTLTAIVNFDTFNMTNCQVNYMVASDGAQGSDSHYALETNDNNTDESCGTATPVEGQQFFGMSRNAPPLFNSYPSGNYLNTGAWYCLTATFDGTNIRTYIDGNLIYIKAWSSPTPSYSSNPNPLLYVGTGFGGTQYYFDGRIDDVQVYDSVQSVTALTKACTDVKNPPLAIKPNAPFDRGVGTAYPNPVNDRLNIPVQNIIGQVTIAIFAPDGRLVERKEVSVSDKASQLQISTEKLSPGTYILSVSTGTDRISRRFSKL